MCNVKATLKKIVLNNGCLMYILARIYIGDRSAFKIYTVLYLLAYLNFFVTLRLYDIIRNFNLAIRESHLGSTSETQDLM